MMGRVLLITVAMVAISATWFWSTYEHDNDSIKSIANSESVRDCLRGDVEVTARLLNLRSLPVNGKVLGQFTGGTRLDASRCTAGWANILASGWVHADYLRNVPESSPAYIVNQGAMASDSPPPSRPADGSNCGTGYREVSASRLNLRTGPDDGAITGQLAVGAGVTVVRCDGDWAEITVAGWAHTHYLSAADNP